MYNSDGTANPGTSYFYEIGNTLVFNPRWSMEVGFGVKSTRYLDGFRGYAYGTTVAVDYTKGKWTGEFQYENGGYTEDGRVDLWYIDQYRRLVSASVAYNF